ncbi:hypothetical protein PtoMrB4_54790 [Metapseudomonas otitidis]|uniref:Uncharacterized protein n=1 Tax=Metapseudomonas otitidis TaxID=319939 RepID=A0A679GQ11_9GAMM|nr:hypothetical protein PtoMrB4_54790 [Pseudomonas otitidis]
MGNPELTRISPSAFESGGRGVNVPLQPAINSTDNSATTRADMTSLLTGLFSVKLSCDADGWLTKQDFLSGART